MDRRFVDLVIPVRERLGLTKKLRFTRFGIKNPIVNEYYMWANVRTRADGAFLPEKALKFFILDGIGTR